MRVIAKRTLREHWEEFGRADSKEPLEAWHAEAEAALWKNYGDIKRTYATASGVGDSRAVFNVGGNKYRLIVKVNYFAGIVFVRFVGTHAEDDQIDARTI